MRIGVLASILGLWGSTARAEGGPVGGGREIPMDGRRVLRVEEVVLEGREQVSRRQIDTILRRYELVPGAELVWPSDPRVTAAREALRATGYFKAVVLRVEPVVDAPDRVTLVVDVAERGTIRVDRLYLGVSRLTPFRGGLSISEQNFLGRGVRLGGALVWGSLPNMDRATRQQAWRVFVEAPRLGTAPLGLLGAGWFVSASEPYQVDGTPGDPDPSLYRPLDYSRIGGMLGLTFPALPHLSFGVDYRFERVDVPSIPTVPPTSPVEPADLWMRPGSHRLTSAHFSVVWDGRKDMVLGGKGGRVTLDLQLSSPALGSSYEYIKLVVAGSYSFRLPWKHWITPRVSGGQIAGDAPRFEMFYVGDLSDWTPGREQGLRYSTRNAIDVFGMGLDERTFGVLFGRVDLEYTWPLFRRTRTRAFYGGDLVFSLGVFTLVEERSARRQRSQAGESVAPLGLNADFGLRLDTALGTVSLTVGNILRRTPL